MRPSRLCHLRSEIRVPRARWRWRTIRVDPQARRLRREVSLDALPGRDREVQCAAPGRAGVRRRRVGAYAEVHPEVHERNVGAGIQKPTTADEEATGPIT